MMWNPFKKKKPSVPIDTSHVPEVTDEMIDQMMRGGEGMPKVGMMQKMALKRLKKMDAKKRKEVFAQTLSPKNVEKNKEKMVEELEQMRASGQMNRKQYRIAKKRLGIH